MKTIGYLRVSTDKQDNNNQKSAVLEYANANGLASVQFVSETSSSRKEDRDIYKVIAKLEPGDVLIIYELSRLARSMNELQSILAKVREQGGTIRIVENGMVIKPDESDILTQTLIFAFSLCAQIERDMISSRTKNALAVRKSKGLPMGRPAGLSRLDGRADEINKYLGMLLNNTAIAKLVGCNPQTLANWLQVKAKNPGSVNPALKYLTMTKKQISHEKVLETFTGYEL
jgi:DNA invertase Pin-like site-specific DNA recombinase